MPHQGLQPQSNGVGIRGRSTRQLRLFDELVVDVEGLFHTDNYTIIVWLIEPYHSGLTLPVGASLQDMQEAVNRYRDAAFDGPSLMSHWEDRAETVPYDSPVPDWLPPYQRHRLPSVGGSSV